MCTNASPRDRRLRLVGVSMLIGFAFWVLLNKENQAVDQLLREADKLENRPEWSQLVKDFLASDVYANLPDGNDRQEMRAVAKSPEWLGKALQAIQPHQVGLMCPFDDVAKLGCHWRFQKTCYDSTDAIRVSFLRSRRNERDGKRAELAFFPHIPKTGSSSLKYFILDQTHVRTKDVTQNRVVEFALFSDYREFILEMKGFLAFTVVRDPLSRIVSSYGIIDQFYKFFGRDEKNALKPYHDLLLEKVENGDPITQFERFNRFFAFLRLIDQLGYWNWHVTPQTAALSQVGNVTRFLHFVGRTSTMDDWMESITTIGPNLRRWSTRNKAESQPIWGRKESEQLRASVKVSAKEILHAADESQGNENFHLANDIIDIVCVLYAMDYRCLEIDMPKRCSFLL